MESNVGNKMKLAFFVKEGLDNFLEEIIISLSKKYEIKKMIITKYTQIEEGMEWADICWFEWCDELLIYGSKLDIAAHKYIVCRLHSYESFTNYPSLVNWINVNKLIVVAKHIRDYVCEKFKLDTNKIAVIPNGIDLDKYTFKERRQGYNIAYVGYINYKKGPMLLLHTFKAIHDRDNRYKLYIAGLFQDERYILYFNQMIQEMGLSGNVIYEGWKDNLNEWMEDKNYILCTSVLESQNISVMQAMAKGIKPIIHGFVGAYDVYREKYIWNTINEAYEMIKEDEYNSIEYRNFIKDNYMLKNQMEKINAAIELIINPNNNNNGFNYIDYWDKRYLNKGTSGLGSYGDLADFKGEIINEFIKDNNINSVIEFGCGDGNQIKKIEYPKYIGLDVSKVSVEKCKEIFLGDSNKEFHLYKPGMIHDLDIKTKPDMAVCLDVLYHIIDEQDFAKTLDDIFRTDCSHIIFYTMLKKPEIQLSQHLKYRNIFDYLSKYKGYTIKKIINQKYPEQSYSDFMVIEKEDEQISVKCLQDVIDNLNEFSAPLQNIINSYEFSNVKILAGKKEKIAENYFLIEFIIQNGKGMKLTLIGIIMDEINQRIMYPEYIRTSNGLNDIDILTKQLMDSNIFDNNEANIINFVLDEDLKKDVESNRLVYLWERAIPGTGFMPLSGYLNIILRYKLAKEFVNVDDSILEAACGFGYGAAYFSGGCKTVEALDISNENIEFGKVAYPIKNITWTEGNVTNLPYENKKFDVYVSFETMEHLEEDMVEQYLKEASRVLKDEGKFIISTPNGVNRKNINNPFHIKEYDLYEFDTLLKKYFNHINYYSQVDYRIVNGISCSTKIMIAVCKK
ncbi:methyltransferase domain-containing protein [Vallitalea guaymasensis]|uniref:methyltransferase domain-containing protein n=1 Tax=Vallitalea guaymasensis TaxID=1185412 RepID=UPI002353C0AC|nr:methyltransferase domain-containing protein [Vallitalea guaymasensis]